jgi:hypothetical protein
MDGGVQALGEAQGRGGSFSFRKPAPYAMRFPVPNGVVGARPDHRAASADPLGACFSGVPLRLALSISGKEDRDVHMAAGSPHPP